MVRFKVISLMIVLSLLLNINIISAGTEFNDIQGHKFESEINYCSDKGYLMGFPDGSFKPDDYVTDAQIKAFCASYISEHNNIRFAKERDNTHWYDLASNVLYQVGIIDNPLLKNPNTKLTQTRVLSQLEPTLDKNGKKDALLDYIKEKKEDRLITRGEFSRIIYVYENGNVKPATIVMKGVRTGGGGGVDGVLESAAFINKMPLQGIPLGEGKGIKTVLEGYYPYGLNGMRFESDNSNISPFVQDDKLMLKSLNQKPGEQAIITGYASDGGKTEFNVIVTDGSFSWPHIVSSYEDFMDIWLLGSGMNYRQAYDVDFKGRSLHTDNVADKYFTGMYDGSGYKMTNVVIDNGETSLFGKTGKNSVIRDIGLIEAKMRSSNTELAAENYGVLASEHNGDIESCNINTSIDINISHGRIGSVVGHNKGKIQNMAVISDIILVGAFEQVGGVCGINEGEISGINAKITGYFDSDMNNIGGIAGYNLEGNIENNDITFTATAKGAKTILGCFAGTNDYGNLINNYGKVNINGSAEGLMAGGVSGSNVGGVAKTNYIEGYANIQADDKTAVGGVVASNSLGGLILGCEIVGQFTITGSGMRFGKIAGENLSEGIIENCRINQLVIKTGESENLDKLAGINLGYIK